MEHGCEHTEGSPIGKCSICDRTVCGECYRDIFGTMICDLHQSLQDEGSWELVGYYSSTAPLVQRRYVLEDAGITSLVVDTDEEKVELYVPAEERDDAFEALLGDRHDTSICDDCHIQYSSEFHECPLCGVKPENQPGEVN